MLRRLGDRVSIWAQRWVPDPLVLAVLLTLLTMIAAAVVSGGDLTLLQVWSGDATHDGFWSLLAFAMQMCLVLVTGHALVESPPLRRLLSRLAAGADSPAYAITIVSMTAMIFAFLNWGLGLIAGAVLARKVGERMRENGAPVHYPLLAAAGYMGLLVWHGGLSGSAPLKATRGRELTEVLGPITADKIGSVPLDQTIGAPGNFVTILLLLVLVPLVLTAMHPSLPQPCPFFGSDDRDAPAPPRDTPANRLMASRTLVALITAIALLAFAQQVMHTGLQDFNLDQLNFGMLFAGLLMHGSLWSYARAATLATRGCTGIILQFPFYAGIMALLQGSGMIVVLSEPLARLPAPALPAAAFYLSGLVNLFVPSGGGQWAVQGPILMEAALQSQVDPSRLIMALAYGDQWTNMLQPFWALPLLAITGVKARDILGYTAVVAAVSQVPFLIGLYL